MDFEKALRLLKNGFKIARKGWNGRNLFIFIVDSAEWRLRYEPVFYGTGSPFIAMRTADFRIVPWVASQTDILADDWIIVE